MKAVCLALACVSLLASGRAEDAALPASKLAPSPAYLVECQMVRVPAKAVVTLVPELDGGKTAPAAWERLQGMIARDEATLAGHLLGRGNEGQVITAESSVELVYPSESLSTNRPPDSHFSRHAAELLKLWPHIGIVPTAFDRQQLGEFLNARVQRTSDPLLLACTVVVRHSEDLGARRFPAGRLENGEKITYDLPRWSEMKNASEILIRPGSPALLDVHPVPGGKQMFELHVLRISPEAKVPSGRAEPAAGWQVKVDLQIVAVPMADALSLVPKLRREEQVGQAAEELQTMIAAGRSELIGWPRVSLDLGRPESEGITGFGETPPTKSVELGWYPTEYGPPQLPGHLVRGNTDPPLEDRLSPSIMVPTAIETPEAGHWFQAAATVDREGRVSVKLASALTVLRAMESPLGIRVKDPQEVMVLQPRFDTLKTEIEVTLPSGGRVLAGTFVEKSARPRMIIFLLHAIAQPSPKLLP